MQSRVPPYDLEQMKFIVAQRNELFSIKQPHFQIKYCKSTVVKISLICRIYFRSKNFIKERFANENEQLTRNNVTKILIFNKVKIIANIRVVLCNIIIQNRNNIEVKCKTCNFFSRTKRELKRRVLKTCIKKDDNF